MLSIRHKFLFALFSTAAVMSTTTAVSAAEAVQHDMNSHDMTVATHGQHGANMWMFEYRYMRMNMNGLMDGTDRVASGATLPYEMLPTTMSMDMHMLMVMYGISDKISVMAMGSVLNNVMSMTMHHGAGAMHNDMQTRGLGDTQLAVAYAVSNPLAVTLGISIPTGSTDEQVVMMPGEAKIRAGYGMQLGSGTFDLIPGFTWNTTEGNHQWGGQGNYAYHLGSHNGYTYGDKLEASAWRKYQIDSGIWTSARLALTVWDKIDGRDLNIDSSMSPDMDPAAQGGKRVDALVGISGGKPMGLTLGLEFGIPVYQNLNGPQMRTTLIATGSLQWMF